MTTLVILAFTGIHTAGVTSSKLVLPTKLQGFAAIKKIVNQKRCNFRCNFYEKLFKSRLIWF
jgi:hypothetical protein